MKKNDDVIRVGGPVERIEKLEVVTPFILRVTFNGGVRGDADMTGLIHKSRHFDVFKNDPEAFARAEIVNHGSGVAWPNGLDYSAGALERMVAAQRDMTGREFTAWQKRVGLSNAETADVLGVTSRTVKLYKKRVGSLPIAVKIACDAMERDRTLVYSRVRAHVRTGRMRKSAA
jgi:hypothetical protein